MNQRPLVLCKSVHHGNTLAVAERIAQSLGATVMDPDQLPSSFAESLPIVGVGSGIYYGRFHRSIRNWIAGLPADFGHGRAVFVYSTSGLPFLSRFYHRPLTRALRKCGFRVVGEFACRGHDTFGPLWLFGGLHRKHPDSTDLQRAEAFAIRLAPLIQHDDIECSQAIHQKVST